MKKIFLLFVVLFTTTIASAQYWYQATTKADELKGTPASSQHYVKMPGQVTIFIEDQKDQISFMLYDGIFNYEKYREFLTVNSSLKI